MLHKVFSSVNKASGLVKEMVANGFFRQCDLAKHDDLQELGKLICNHYGAPAPADLILDPAVARGMNWNGTYNPRIKVITIDKYSIITYLHELRHHLQHHGGVRIIRGKEHDAQAWACSVFFKACPRMFKQAVEAGRIMGVGRV